MGRGRRRGRTCSCDLTFANAFAQILDVHSNVLEELPGEIGMLSCLVVLDLSHNHLTDLPLTLANLSNLQTLNVMGAFG